MKARSAYRPAPEHVAAACLVALVGLGLISGVIGMGSLILLLLDGSLRLLGRYVRTNYRLLKREDEE